MLGQSHSVHSRHDDISQQHLDPWFLLQKPQSCFARVSTESLEAQCLKKLDGGVEDVCLIVDNENAQSKWPDNVIDTSYSRSNGRIERIRTVVVVNACAECARDFVLQIAAVN